MVQRVTRKNEVTKIEENLSNSLLCKEFFKPFWDYENCPYIRGRLLRGGTFSKKIANDNRVFLIKRILPTFAKIKITEITPLMCEDWLLSLPSRYKISNKTANNVWNCFRLMLDVAVKQGLIEKNPCDNIRPFVVNGKPRGAFTQDDIKLLFDDPKHWHSELAFVGSLLSAMTGMRQGEILALRPCQIKEGYIIVDASYSRTEGLKSTKNGKPRIVPISPQLQEMLKRLSCRNRFIFSFSGTKPVANAFFIKHLDKRMNEVGINYKKRGLCFHSFRHFYNTQLVASGMSGEMVRAIIGHESTSMTDRYLHLANENLSELNKVQTKLENLILS